MTTAAHPSHIQPPSNAIVIANSSTQVQGQLEQYQHRQEIVFDVPQKVINGGLDFKFDGEAELPRSLVTTGLLSQEEYSQWIARLNESIRIFRAKKVDMAALAFAPVPFVLPMWGMRRKNKAKQRRLSMQQVIDEFNFAHNKNGIRMKWMRNPISQLRVTFYENQSNQNSKLVHGDASVVQPNTNIINGHISGVPQLEPFSDINMSTQQKESVNNNNMSLDLLDMNFDHNTQQSTSVTQNGMPVGSGSTVANPFDSFVSRPPTNQVSTNEMFHIFASLSNILMGQIQPTSSSALISHPYYQNNQSQNNYTM